MLLVPKRKIDYQYCGAIHTVRICTAIISPFFDLSKVLPISLIAVVTFVVFFACGSSSHDTQLDTAHSHYLQGRTEQAKQLLDEIIVANPNASDAFLLRGKLHEDDSDYLKAIADYSSVINQRPKLSQAWSLRGSSYYQIDAFQNAIRDFSTAIELEPGNADLYLYLGNSYGELDMFADAIKNFNIAREISYGDYYGNLSKAYHDLNTENYSSALGRASSAIEENPTDPMPYLYKGIALYYLGEIDGSTFHLETALDLNPDNPTILYNLGQAYLASSDPNLAITHLQSALAIDPSLKPYINLTGIFEDK